MRTLALLTLPLLLAACATSTDPFHGNEDGGNDADLTLDGAGNDGSNDGATAKDASAGNDATAPGDGGPSGDGSSGDGSVKVDSGPPLLGPPCTHGAGWIAWKFHYNGSTSASTDVYSLPDSSNWEAVPAYPNSTSWADALHGGGIDMASGNWILIRFSLVGLTQIKSATLSMYGRSYDTTTSGSFEAWSPIYGSIFAPQNSISNAWPYQWKSVDYTANVNVGDTPGLTGIRFKAGPSSNDLIINTVELCIDGS
ncbi:MAG TPA: hypothetical protein VF316_21410 [Polyangiaceae bacterium]